MLCGSTLKWMVHFVRLVHFLEPGGRGVGGLVVSVLVCDELTGRWFEN